MHIKHAMFKKMEKIQNKTNKPLNVTVEQYMNPNYVIPNLSGIRFSLPSCCNKSHLNFMTIAL